MVDTTEVAVTLAGTAVMIGTMYAMGSLLPDGSPWATRAIALTAVSMSVFNWNNPQVFPSALSNGIVVARGLALNFLVTEVRKQLPEARRLISAR